MPKFYTNIDLNKNQLKNAAVHNVPDSQSIPSSPSAGQIYFDTNSSSSTYNRLLIRRSQDSTFISIPYSGNIANADLVDNTIQIGKIDTTSVRLNNIGTPIANVNLGGYKITNLATPATGDASSTAATKGYVDAAVSGLNVHAPAQVTSYGSESYTVTGTAISQISGTTIDTYSPQVNDRILVRNAPANGASGTGSAVGTTTTSVLNGVYVVTNNTTNLTVQRANDYNGDVVGEVASGDYILVLNGSQKGNSYIMSTTGTITVGTTAIAFTQFGQVTNYTAGNGLSLSGSNQFSIDTSITVDKTTAQTLTNKTFTDNVTFFQNSATNSKKVKFDLGSISAATTRTLTVPDSDGIIALTTSNVSSATTATTATNVTGGANGSLVYQTGSGTTSTLAIGTSNYILTSSGTTPQWTAPATVRSNINATGKYTTTFTASSGTVVKTITQATHGLASSRNLLVQVSDSSGNVVYADINIGSTGTVTITFADLSGSYDTYDITIIG